MGMRGEGNKLQGETRNCLWCGNPFYASRSKIKAGEGKYCNRSCAGRVATRRHGHNGLIRNPTYASWAAMIQRTTNPKNKAFKDYGGRGIGVCDRWRDYQNFLTDMGEKPMGLELERRNNNLGYEPINCYWATHKEQMRNRRSNHMLTIGDRTQCLADWEAETGIPDSTIQWRLKQGYDPFLPRQARG